MRAFKVIENGAFDIKGGQRRQSSFLVGFAILGLDCERLKRNFDCTRIFHYVMKLVGYVQSFTRDGKRIQGENAYLQPVRQRRNLRVRTGAHVTRVLIKPDTNEAYGVEYMKNGLIYQVYARNEVILSAGSMKSPQILMLSGIGPKDHLQELGIPLIEDLPVGQLMYDHSTALVVTYVLNAGVTIVTPRDLIDPDTYENYLLDGTGPFSVVGTVEALTYVKTNVTDPEYPTWPDIELIFSCASPVTEFGTFLRPLFNIPRETYNVVWKPITGKPAITVLSQLMHPRSVGYIRLRSVNPLDEPRYFTNFLSDPENKDIRAHIAAIREIQRIVSQPALQRYGPKIIDTPIPGCANFTFDTDEYWECALRELTASFWHQQATCKMGPKSDKEAVVDARLRVHGINKLRVVDTGIIPRSISAHLSGPAYMIGEKGADIIKQDWGELPVPNSHLETQSEPHSESDLRPGSKTHSKLQLEPEVKSEAKSDSEPELKSETKSHSGSQLEPELKPHSE
ncbi:unnamed protein product [Callosobruchus maculatus]|uniref:Glucose-methanol-choline oxidoreductase N-terminal domain-containing protein n=1 Tax=Callosobruchus maculatus TaxID=64391 RepID=A0A653CBK6_CALMS|nr:unnamed protein product [Callosobruchus maculatus]